MSRTGGLWRDAPPAPVLARRLLGQVLHSRAGGVRTSGRIVETEAYLSAGDPSCHAHRGRTGRNASMFAAAGTAYVYRIYGMHLCFNVASGRTGQGEAVLIRALEPLEGLDAMAGRRGIELDGPRGLGNLCSGPGKLAVALGVTLEHDGHVLGREPLWCERGVALDPHRVRVDRRIGLGKAEELALRFSERGSAFVSR